MIHVHHLWGRFLLIFFLAYEHLTVTAFRINATGGSFPGNVYFDATFAYQFTQSADFVKYFGLGSSVGQCNIMGYWNTGNTEISDAVVSQAIKKRDTAICSNACTTALCGSTTPYFDNQSRNPVVDWAGSDALLTATQYKYFPDLQMLPALAGAVVPVYNIPVLGNQTFVLSRATIAAIFTGEIQYWSDSRIVADNAGSAAVAATLQKIASPISVVVRTDSSGTSQIFATALSRFSSTGSSSFASVVGSSSKPTWCGALTDEVQVITITGCTAAAVAGSGKLVHMVFVDGTYAVRDLLFSCGASAQNLTSMFASSARASSGFNVTVYRSSSGNQVKYTIGFSDPQTVAKDWYKLRLISAPTGVTVNVTTLQEGGFTNSHFNSSAYYVTPVIQSLWLSQAAAPFQFQISWRSGNSNKQYSTGAVSYASSQNIAQSIYTSINAVASGAVLNVTRADHPQSTWTEYRLTFASSADALSYSNFTATSTAAVGSVYILTLLDSNNYPLFYDSSHPSGFGGSGR
jgi:PBP superfamily domain